VVTIEELGILRDVQVDPDTGRVTVTITPTYAGCPALDMIRADIRHALRAAGYPDVEVRTSLRPARSTDEITDSGRAKLAAAYISPPGGVGAVTLSVRCPRCRSPDTQGLSRFGSTRAGAVALPGVRGAVRTREGAMSERSERIVGAVRLSLVAARAKRSAGMSERSERIVGRSAVEPRGGAARSAGMAAQRANRWARAVEPPAERRAGMASSSPGRCAGGRCSIRCRSRPSTGSPTTRSRSPLVPAELRDVYAFEPASTSRSSTSGRPPAGHPPLVLHLLDPDRPGRHGRLRIGVRRSRAVRSPSMPRRRCTPATPST
jgi:ring-1,2-phenylacetyl-CoA epoxidase subunit PaaD